MSRDNASSRAAAWLVALLGLAAAGGASAHRHGRAAAAARGDFDYYLLSLSWSPAYCAESRRGAECSGPQRFGFVVHGLWPQRDRGRLEYCADGGKVPAGVARGLADLMPDRRLVFHEWRAHGSCSGLAPAAYFAALRRAAASVAIPPGLRRPRVARTVAPRVLVGELLRANPQLRADGVVIACGRDGEPRFTELRVCLARDLSPRACSATATAGRCRAPLVRVLPVR